ncbi:hypothetical protein LEMLEM_LOCUS10806, partial [Lemmus lemmus]
AVSIMEEITTWITEKFLRDDLKLLITEDGVWRKFVAAAALSRLPACCTQHCPPDHEDEDFPGQAYALEAVPGNLMVTIVILDIIISTVIIHKSLPKG